MSILTHFRVLFTRPLDRLVYLVWPVERLPSEVDVDIDAARHRDD